MCTSKADASPALRSGRRRLDRRRFLAVAIVGMLLLSVGSGSARADFRRAKTVFQTNVAYDPRVAIAVDAVIVHRHAAEARELIDSWQQAGFQVGRMFFADSDAGNRYWTGKWDGREHPGDVERDRDGRVVKCAGVRPYMLPTEGWIRFLEENTIRSLDAGAAAILPEEPLAHVYTGYESAFRPIWQRRYGIPWRGQHEDAEARWLTAQLKNELYVELEHRLALKTKTYARTHGRDIGFILPIHSLYSNVAAQLVAPLGTSLPIEGVDGYIGQIWTGPVNWALGHYDAPDKPFFASAYVLYDYFTQLTAETDRKLWLLVDPVEDNPNHTWAEFAEWYRHCVTAMLMMEDVESYEIMPWPDRIFLPGYGTGGGTPAPQDYRITILSITQVLQEIPRGGVRAGPDVIPATADAPDTARPSTVHNGPRGRIGVAVADTLMWQRHDGPWLQGTYGMLLPLVKRGFDVSSCILERAGEQAYMSRFSTIVLAYEDFKPLNPAWNEHLATWVRQGGRLIVLDAQPTELDRCPNMWWRKAGFDSPQEHLLSLLASPDTASLSWRVGQGRVRRLDIQPRQLGRLPEPTRRYVAAVAAEASSTGPGNRVTWRSPYVIAHAGTRSLVLDDGPFVDVFDADLPVIRRVVLPPGHSGVYKSIAPAMSGPAPQVLHATHRLVQVQTRPSHGQDAPPTTAGAVSSSAVRTTPRPKPPGLRFTIRGPAGTPAVTRVYLGSLRTPQITATDAAGRSLDVDLKHDRTTRTVQIRFPNDPQGVTVNLAGQ